MVVRPPRVGQVTRVPLTGGREAMQVAYGVGQGMIQFPFGVLAVVERRGKSVRAIALDEASGTVDVTDSPAGAPLELNALHKGTFGETEVLLVDEPDAPWGEQYEGRSQVNARGVHGDKLVDLGRMVLTRRSNPAFWRGPYRWTMESPGLEPEPGGYVVHETWTFTGKKTRVTTHRYLERRYRLSAGKVVATPQEDHDRWKETRADWPADAPFIEDEP
jgi:hypothetical protein